MRMKIFSVDGVLLIVLLQTFPVWSQYYTRCGGDLTAPSGVIQSPNYPAAYPNYTRCHWIISVAQNEIIDLRFTRLDLDGKSYQGIWSPATCPDFVDIYDGDSTTSPLLMRMCRYMNESELASVYIRSTSNKMHIYFESDYRAARTGFQAPYWAHECAEFTYGPQKCNMTCNCKKEHTASCNSINGTCNCKKGWTGADCSTDVNECQTSLVELCPDYQECHNTAGSFECHCRPGLQMNDSGHCEVEVGALCMQRQCSHLCAKISSQSPQEQCYCPNDMKLQGDICQACDNTHFGKDCHLKCNCSVTNTKLCDSSTGGCVCKEGWTSDICSEDINECELPNSVCKKQDEDCINTPGGYRCIGCNFTMSDPSGIIISSSYPNTYTSGLRCNWTITSTKADSTILLRFSDFQIGACYNARQSCTCDYVEVYDGNNASAPLLGRFCARQPNPIRSTGNSMYIHFHGDRTGFKGFNGTYITLGPESYRFTETALTGNIVSPGYPYGSRKNTFSYWTITVTPDSVIAVNITDLDLEDSLNCEHHYVEFYDGSHAGNTLLGHYCNLNKISDWIFTTGNNMTIIFSSNGSLSESGFAGNYLTSACKCNRDNGQKSCNNPFSPCTCITGWEGSDCSIDTNECTKNMCPDYSKCYNNPGSFQCYCRNGSLAQPTDVCDSCNTTLTSPSGYFSSPGSPLYTWHQYMFCSWTITGTRDTVVSLRFPYFNVWERSNCYSGSVQIYDGSDPNSPLLGQYCGTFVPSLLRSSGNSMHIVIQLSYDYGVFNASYYTHACHHLTYGERCEKDCRCSGDHTQICDNIYGLCKCKTGWTGPSCLDDINECKHENVCPANSECQNTIGSYICDCNSGYVMDTVTGLCKESSNCTIKDRKKCSHLCILVNNKTKCLCPENMKLDVDGKTCFVELYPHGEKVAGDYKLSPSSSTTSFNKLHNEIPYVGPVKFSTGIPVGNAHSYEPEVYFLINGVIAFDIQNIPLTPDFSSLDNGKSKIVAALWTKVVNINGGEMFFHLYEKCNTSVFQEGVQDMKSPQKSEVIKRAAKDIAEFYKFSQFDVSTALVVTWKAIPNNCNSLQASNTFQAILVSGHGAKADHFFDEETSYVIFIYQAGQVSGLCKPGQPIEVGVVTGSMKNQPVAQFSGQLDKVTGNTGYKGVMTFKVGQMDNPQVKCQSYICKYSYLLSDRIYQAEIEELYKCPCSLDRLGLQWELFTDSGNVRCYIIRHVAKRRLLGNNKRNRLCCYTWTQPLSNSWQDMRASVLKGSYLPKPESHVLISDPWSNPNSDVYHSANENMNAHQWCCDKSPRKQCDRFYKIFPEGGCTKNPVFVPASALGDPHIVTLDNFTYTMNGWGEYILMDIQTKNFTLQARTSRLETSNGILANATVFTAFAAGESNYANFQVELAATNTTMVVLANGMDFTNKFYDNTNFDWSNKNISIQRDNSYNRIAVAVSFSCGVSLKVHVGVKSLQIDVEVDKQLKQLTRGLLGNFNDNPNDDFQLPTGTILQYSISEREILQSFVSKYVVTPETSVFTYDKGKSTTDFQHPEFVPLFFNEIDSQTMANANAVCGENAACLYDFIATKDEAFARNTKISKKEIDSIARDLKNSPPSVRLVTTEVINNKHWLVTEGRDNYLKVEGLDEDGDTISYELVNTSGLRLNQDGTIIYAPNLNQPISLRIRVKDSKGSYSPVLSVPIDVCPNCNSHGSCDLNAIDAEYLRGQFAILKCRCHPAYTGTFCDSEIDACKPSPCSKGQTCKDLSAAEQGGSPVGYECGPCPSGSIEINGTCVDINECEDITVCDQECTDIEGSYLCSCRTGFRLNPADKKSCIDINECEERTSTCQQGCTNKEGGYTCSCVKGYTLDSDNLTCTINSDIKIACQKCEQVCLFNNGQITCDCNRGFKLRNGQCIDIDECDSSGNPPCSQTCKNTVGNFECSCKTGYRLDTDGVSCTECESPYYGENCSSICESTGRGTCDAIRGCVCEENWTGVRCDLDVDECSSYDACSSGLVCQNEFGSFSCICPAGYRMENDICSDIDECSEFQTNIGCDPVTEDCTNNEGSYTCKCKDGFALKVNSICEDIDECEKQIDGCEHICTNGPGNYRCECHQGYSLAVNRHSCEKRENLCNLNCSHGCSLDENSVPFCICPLGYHQITSNTCEDINECALDDTNLCSYKSGCVNKDGGFHCSCEIGFRLDNDGRSCIPCSGGTWGVECANTCACGLGASRCDSVSGCICKAGFSGTHCTEDENGCLNQNLTCGANEECVNAPGIDVCQCKKGFQYVNGAGCQDENECLNERLHNCRQKCINTEGSFRCSCYPGYNASTDSCHDINECDLQTSKCTYTCINTVGSYQCSCPSNLVLQADGLTCAACADAENGCQTSCTCQETNTDHCNITTGECVCKDGWTSADCSVDVDECQQNPCPEYRACKNLDGSFECVCWSGLQFNSNGSCSDCNRTLTGSSGRIMSSNYPQSYPSNSYCTWTILASESQATILFSFEDYNVEGCPYDFVEIYDGINPAAPSLGQYCGDVPPPVTSTGNSMHIVFVSDSSQNEKGFRASYFVELKCKLKTCSHTCSVTSTNPWTEECLCPEWMQLNQTDWETCMDINACNATVTRASGYIVSPQYPEIYPTNAHCYWKVQGKQNSIITLRFDKMDMEGSLNCPYDSVEIFEGEGESAASTSLGRFCGDAAPSLITSSGNKVFILFKSDDAVGGSGFKISYNIQDN